MQWNDLILPPINLWNFPKQFHSTTNMDTYHIEQALRETKSSRSIEDIIYAVWCLLDEVKSLEERITALENKE